MSIKEKYASKIKAPFCVKSMGNNETVNTPLIELFKEVLDEFSSIGGSFDYYGVDEKGYYDFWDKVDCFGGNTHLYSFEELQDIVNSVNEGVVSKPSPSKISFPCAVNIEGFTEDTIIDLTNAFVELGADDKENNDTNDHNCWRYYGVDSEGGTRFWDYLNDFSSAEDESEVTVYSYEEVMAMVSSEEPKEENTQQLTPAYEVGDVVEIIDNSCEHGFETGQHVRLCSCDSDGAWAAKDLEGSAFWYIEEDEFKPVSSVSDNLETSCSDDTAISEENEYSGNTSGETGCNQSVGSSIGVSTNVSFTVKIKGQEFVLTKEEVSELYLALCVAEGELKDWSIG